MSASPLAICESCWLVENARYVPESIDENGRVIVRLMGVGLPDSVRAESVEICCMCGELTIVGIYILRDPEQVPFPDSIDSENFDFEIGIMESRPLYEDDDDDPYEDNE